MTMKRVDESSTSNVVPVMDVTALPSDLNKALKFSNASDEEVGSAATLRSQSEPWKSRGETYDQSLDALTALRPFIHLARLETNVVGYFTVERDGPVQGAAYMRNIVVKPELRAKGLGTALLDQALQVARDMHRRTLALRVDPANGPAVSFYRKAGFTTVATVVSKKSGKLRLLMSKEL